MKKHFILVFILPLFFVSCKKEPTQDSLVAEKLKGEWELISTKKDGVETLNMANKKSILTLFDVDFNKGRYNLKEFKLNVLNSETEGEYSITSNGSVIVFKQDNFEEINPLTINLTTENQLEITNTRVTQIYQR